MARFRDTGEECNQLWQNAPKVSRYSLRRNAIARDEYNLKEEDNLKEEYILLGKRTTHYGRIQNCAPRHKN